MALSELLQQFRKCKNLETARFFGCLSFSLLGGLGIFATLVLLLDTAGGVPVAVLDCLLLAILPLRLPARALTLKSGCDVSVGTTAPCPLLGGKVDEADFEFEEDRTGMAGTS